MDHTARFAADSLHKEYPEPEQLPEHARLVLVMEKDICFVAGNSPTIFTPAFPGIPGLLKEQAQYLGHRGPVPCYALEIPVTVPVPGGLLRSSVRELAGVVTDEELAIAGLAVQVTDYDRTTRFCGMCGTPTKPARTERAKVCPSCNHVTYARISPAIIVLVKNRDSILLVRGPQAPPGRHSLVAGFVEPGETIEHAVHREVLEETAIAINNVRYIASEPWPFPNSLMIGFVAEYAGGTATPDGSEIASAGWFDRENLPPLPPNLSISHHLMAAWLSGKL